MKNLEKRVEVLESLESGREQVIVMCLPGGEEEALRQHLQQHPEHKDAERFEIVLVSSGIPRCPVDPLPPGLERDPKHAEQPMPVSDSAMSGERQYRRNAEGQDAFHTDPGPFPYRR